MEDNIKMHIKYSVWGCWMDSADSRQCPVADLVNMVINLQVP